MRFSDFFIRRPVFAIVANMILVIIGLYALSQLAIRQLPEFVIPTVTVTAVLPGASPKQMADQVSTEIEVAVSGLDGIALISSISRQSISTVRVQFRSDFSERDLASQVRQKISEVSNRLPNELEPPVVQQIDLSSVPIMYLGVSDPRRSALEITDTIERVIKPQLATVPGIARTTILGERRYAMRIELNPVRMAAHGVTADDIVTALISQNAHIPAGSIRDQNSIVPVIAETTVDTPYEFQQIVLREEQGMLLRLSDVAGVEVGPEETKTGMILKGAEGVGIGIVPQSAANPLEVAKDVRRKLVEIRSTLPRGMTIEVAYDSTIYIQRSLEEVSETVLIAVGLVIFVIFLFLGSLRSSFVTLVTIPISLIGTLAFLMVMGYSLNTFTLLAFVLAVGLVVDDAIVDVENVSRHISDGLSPIDAAFVGSREIGFAIVATTITLASVFLPIGLMPGMAGQLFREFAFSLAAAIIISGYISRTLSPMMCSRLLRAKREGGLETWIDRQFERLSRAYARALTAALNHRWAVTLLGLVLFVLGIGMASSLETEMAPIEDDGYLLVLYTGPDNASYPYMSRQAKALDAVLRKVPEGESVLTLVGSPAPNQGYGFLVLKPWEDRKRSATEIAAALRPSLTELPGVEASFLDTDPLRGDGQKPIQFVIRTTGSYAALAEFMDGFVQKAKSVPGLIDPTVDLKLNAPQFDLVIDRSLAGDLGIDMAKVANALGATLGQHKVTRFDWEDELYYVIADVAKSAGPPRDVIEQLNLRTEKGELVPLAAFLSGKEMVGATALPRFGQQNSTTLEANVAPGHGAGEVLNDLVALAEKELLPGMTYDFAGPSRQLRQASAATLLVFVFAILFIYFVMCAQFESFRDPAIVLLGVPLSVVGAMTALEIGGGSLNLYSAIGVITLVGLIAKHGILITEFANQLRDEGQDLRAAVVNAASIRLRPILMTTIAMVLGAAPLLLATGPGAVGRHDIGIVIVGGMLLGTLFSLFIVPVIYTYLTPKVREPLVQPPPVS